MNDEKFPYTKIALNPKYKLGYDLENLYQEAHTELSLQQSKRDQTIALYITIFSLLLPISFSIEALSNYRFLIFLFLGIFGLLFSEIVLRYRIYKEVYWLTCITIMDLTGYEKEKIDKKLVQAIFYNNMYKKGSFVRRCFDEKKKKLHFFKLAFSLISSAETLHYCLVAITTALCFSLTIYTFLTNLMTMNFHFCFIPIAIFILIFIGLYFWYVRKVKLIYLVLLDGKNSSFNFTFGKAWFLFLNE